MLRFWFTHVVCIVRMVTHRGTYWLSRCHCLSIKRWPHLTNYVCTCVSVELNIPCNNTVKILKPDIQTRKHCQGNWLIAKHFDILSVTLNLSCSNNSLLTFCCVIRLYKQITTEYIQNACQKLKKSILLLSLLSLSSLFFL